MKIPLMLLKQITTRGLCHFITTPIFYVNSLPHVGHVHTLLLADALNIHQRLKRNSCDTLFSTGTDEHGIKIQNAADLSRRNYLNFCDSNAKEFQWLFTKFDTTLSDFIRTTEERHVNAVQKLWTELNERGFIYKKEYSGWYCTSDETFVPESQVVTKDVDGQVTHTDNDGNHLVWSSEQNYVFRFSEVERQVYDWLSTEKPVIPEKFNAEALAILKQFQVEDISISRPKSRLNWGITVPDDDSQTIYVWLDALTNYLTVAGYPCQKNELKRWPIDCQVLGKDIIKFHAIYWPAFLIALSLPLPRKLLCHSHWLKDSLKMSKSRGNVVDPFVELQLLTSEGLRYYLLRASTPHSDTDYNHTQARRLINAELADTYGNLFGRCCSPAINSKQVIPTTIVEKTSPEADELIGRLSSLPSECDRHFENADFYKGVDLIMAVLRLNNTLYENAKPWKLVKEVDENSLKLLTNIQALTFECLRICSILLQPVAPKLADLALRRLNVEHRSWADAKVSLLGFEGNPAISERPLGSIENEIMFPRLREP